MRYWEEFNVSFRNYCIDQISRRLSGLPQIYKICVYPFEIGGKFFRPFLLYNVAKFINPSVESDKLMIFPFAFSLELIHNYSLIHDDLPCMDNEDYRRGAPTIHKKFGEAEAVLAGDMLLTLAFEFLSINQNFESRKLIKIIKKVSQYSSYRYLITGQFLDIWFQKSKIENNLDNIKWINFYKTAGLILLAVEIPIILFEPIYKVKYDLVRYGYLLGLLFQITDDIIDNDGISLFIQKDKLLETSRLIYEKITKIHLDLDLMAIADFVYNRIRD